MSGNKEKADFESNAIYIGIALFVMILVAWFLLGPFITSLYGVIRRYEMMPFAAFSTSAAGLYGKLVDLNGESLDFSNFVGMLNSTGYYVRWLFLPIPPILAFLILRGSVQLKYQTTHSMRSLAKQESALWPEISPVIGKQKELLDSDEHSGGFAVALTEWEFAEKHNLANKKDGVLNKDAARKVFAAQLGPRWSGPSKLPPYKKGLYAVFVLRMSDQGDLALKMLRLMAKTFAEKGVDGMDTSWADGVIAKYGKNPNISRAISQHAYTNTLLATMLQLSRGDGVLASPMFIWLKTVDRGLWYLLNNVGHYAFHVECAGVAAHWLYEKTVGEACITPMVENAVSQRAMRKVNDTMKDVLIGGLEMALSEYAEDDSLDRLYR
jgi:intracellular multiplication protein IcmP